MHLKRRLLKRSSRKWTQQNHIMFWSTTVWEARSRSGISHQRTLFCTSKSNLQKNKREGQCSPLFCTFCPTSTDHKACLHTRLHLLVTLSLTKLGAGGEAELTGVERGRSKTQSSRNRCCVELPRLCLAPFLSSFSSLTKSYFILTYYGGHASKRKRRENVPLLLEGCLWLQMK